MRDIERGVIAWAERQEGDLAEAQVKCPRADWLLLLWTVEEPIERICQVFVELVEGELEVLEGLPGRDASRAALDLIQRQPLRWLQRRRLERLRREELLSAKKAVERDAGLDEARRTRASSVLLVVERLSSAVARGREAKDLASTYSCVSPARRLLAMVDGWLSLQRSDAAGGAGVYRTAAADVDAVRSRELAREMRDALARQPPLTRAEALERVELEPSTPRFLFEAASLSVLWWVSVTTVATFWGHLAGVIFCSVAGLGMVGVALIHLGKGSGWVGAALWFGTILPAALFGPAVVGSIDFESRTTSVSELPNHADVDVFVLEDGEVRAEMRTSICRTSRSRSGGSTTRCYAVAPLVPEAGWSAADPVPAWVVCSGSSSVDRSCLARWEMRPHEARRISDFQSDSFAEALAAAEAEHDLTSAPDAPVLRLVNSGRESLEFEAKMALAMWLAFVGFPVFVGTVAHFRARRSRESP